MSIQLKHIFKIKSQRHIKKNDSNSNILYEDDGFVKDFLGKYSKMPLEKILANNFIRNNLLKKGDERLKQTLLSYKKYPAHVQEDKYYMARNLIHTANNAYINARTAPGIKKALLNSFAINIYLKKKESLKRFQNEFGRNPPSFLTISPSKFCNLKCTGCYANSSSKATESLDWDVLDRIMTEKTNLWNSYFTVISGGEPFLYKSQSKTILDLARNHPENYFLVYTNGTLIDKQMAKELADVGNITPSISVEGFENETNTRRGPGVYEKTMDAMRYLRKEKVPFGISLTATKNNADLVVSDRLMDFYFQECGVSYAWIFQLMPIGRADSLEMMVTPDQRVKMFRQTQHLVRDKQYFIADFWNSGCLTNGCISAGKESGYLYIDWHGNITPCVFNPYSPVNILDIYKRGGTLNDALKEPFFVAIQEWQKQYSLDRKADEIGNLITPCAIKDHYDVMTQFLKEYNPKPIDEAAEIALNDTDYQKGLIDYGVKVQDATDEIWKNEYLR